MLKMKSKSGESNRFIIFRPGQAAPGLQELATELVAPPSIQNFTRYMVSTGIIYEKYHIVIIGIVKKIADSASTAPAK